MTASLELGGKTRELKLTLRALRHFKQHFGKPMWRIRLTGLNEVMPELALDTVCLTHVVWAALLHSDPELTFDDVEEMLQNYVDSGGDNLKLGEAVKTAFETSGLFGERPKEGAKKKRPNEQRGPLN